ncbi:hypothetical protein DFH09DRAFT_578343 [Mycena vulgaris]|nr:hypothetical protein DFH09DRAFT_578343 [Mycena vulgaris]
MRPLVVFAALRSLLMGGTKWRIRVRVEDDISPTRRWLRSSIPEMYYRCRHRAPFLSVLSVHPSIHPSIPFSFPPRSSTHADSHPRSTSVPCTPIDSCDFLRNRGGVRCYGHRNGSVCSQIATHSKDD